MSGTMQATWQLRAASQSDKMDDGNAEELRANLRMLHTTELGAERIRRNLSLENVDDVVSWCREQITKPDTQIRKNGKNWYARAGDDEITIHSRSYTIITAHKI